MRLSRRFRARFGLVPGACLLASLLLAGAAPPSSPAPARAVARKHPDLILITAEGLRPDRLSCYKGKQAASTPNIDSLAAQGRLFTQVLTSSPSSLPALATLLTGEYPSRHHVWDDHYRNHLSADALTLAERLKKAGYDTAAFLATSRPAAERGFDQGFDLYQNGYHQVPAGVWKLEERPGKRVLPAARSWLEGEKTAPVFLWIHLIEPSLPPRGAQTQPMRDFEVAAYAGHVAEFDGYVGEILALLKEQGRYKNAVIVLTADHGMGLGEHDEWRSGVFLYDSTVRVPLVIKTPPGDTARGSRSESLAGLVDLFPTVERLLGLPATPGLAGRDLLASPPSSSKTVYSAVALFGREMFGWHGLQLTARGTLRLIVGASTELYDVATDPGEEHDLAATAGDRLRALRREAEPFSAGWTPPPAHFLPRQGLPPEINAKLVAKGFAPATPEKARQRKLPDPHRFQSGLRLLEIAVPGMDFVGFPALVKVRDDLLQADPDNLFSRLTVAQIDFARNYKNPAGLSAVGESLKKTQAIYPLESEVYHLLGHLAAVQEKYADAELFFVAASDLSPVNPGEVSYDIACAYAREGKKEAAIKQLKDAIHLGYRDGSHMASDPDLDSLRQDPAYKRLMQDEFPGAR